MDHALLALEMTITNELRWNSTKSIGEGGRRLLIGVDFQNLKHSNIWK